MFRYSLVEPLADVAAEAAAFRPAFGHLALLLQIPGVDVTERMTVEKGVPLTERERRILDERIAAARRWLEDYAPERARLVVRDTLPPEADELDDAQRRFLAALSTTGERRAPASGEEWQAFIFEVAEANELPQRKAFEAVYLAFLGRANGPRAGWLLASLDPEFVRTRTREAAAVAAA